MDVLLVTWFNWLTMVFFACINAHLTEKGKAYCSPFALLFQDTFTVLFNK